MVLLKTDRKIVTRARDYEYVGVGDSSLLRHINHLIGNKPEYRRASFGRIPSYASKALHRRMRRGYRCFCHSAKCHAGIKKRRNIQP